MKMTWKRNVGDSRNKNRKRPFLLSAHLPFHHDSSSPDMLAPREILGGNELRGRSEFANKKPLIFESECEETGNTARNFESRGNKLAEEGKFREALGKWQSAITLMPERAVLHEQKAQVLLELGEAWNALKAATRATELEPGWAEAWITLGRAQLHFGEPDCAIESFDKALAIKPNIVEAKDDRQTALNLVKRRRQLHSSTAISNQGRIDVRN